MRFYRMIAVSLALALMLGLAACSQQRAGQSPKANVERQFEQAGMKDIDVNEDREKKVLTLSGEVQSQEAKDRAGEMAQNSSPGWVVANELSVRPEGAEGEARKIESHLDEAIENDLKAALIARKLDNKVDFEVNNGVVTLKGELPSMEQREEVEKMAAKTPNVQQVVNEIQVKQAKGR